MPKGSLKWAFWLLIIAVSFAVMEAYSFYDNTSTLSRFIWNVSEAFRPFEYIAGFLTGFLVCHFWWGGRVGFGKPDEKEDGG
jgi:hypothetical protein